MTDSPFQKKEKETNKEPK